MRVQFCSYKYILPWNPAFFDCFAYLSLIAVCCSCIDVPIPNLQGLENRLLYPIIAIVTLEGAETDCRNLDVVDIEAWDFFRYRRHLQGWLVVEGGSRKR